MKPIVAVTWLNSSPAITPAMPASAEPMKNVAVIVRFTLMPSISAASRSAATARICLPSLVRLTSSRSPTISTRPSTRTMICTASMLTDPIVDPGRERDEVRRVVDPRLRAEQQQRRVLQEERDADRGDQRRDPRRVTQRPVGEALDRDAEPAAPSPAASTNMITSSSGTGIVSADRPAEPLDHEVADVRPDHVQVAVREVEQLQHAVDHRVAQRDQRVERAGGDAVDQLLEEERHARRVLPARHAARRAPGS